MHPLHQFKTTLSALHNAVTLAQEKNVTIQTSTGVALHDYAARREQHIAQSVIQGVGQVKRAAQQLTPSYTGEQLQTVMQILELTNRMSIDDTTILCAHLETISDLTSRLPRSESLHLGNVRVPTDVAEEVHADIAELKRCFSSHCYRSAVILCGRLLEIALHRKYYEVTGMDILETNPGVGLGKLIAKLEERNVDFDPGLTNQIHLINQVRISSVHKKKQPFLPSEEQTRAIILYTLDAVRKIFGQ